LNKEDEWIIACDAYRTQEENRKACIEKLVTEVQKLEDALITPPEPSPAQKARVQAHEKQFDATRRKDKTHQSAKKTLRSKRFSFSD
jgi:hypothetical protein